MTFTSLFGVKNQDVDPIHVANAIGSLLQSLGSGDTTSSAPGPLSGNYDNLSHASPATPATPAQPTPTPSPSQPATPAAQTAQGDTSSYPVTQAFGVNGEAGIDLGAPIGTPVITPLAGTVTYAGSDDSGFGKMISIDHGNGISTIYGHISGFNVQTGDKVVAGQVIAPSGNEGHSSGPHLEFQVRVNGTPVNPAQYLAQGWQVLGKPGTAGPSASQIAGASSEPAPAPPRPVNPQDAADTGIARLTGALTGNDPGSENARTPEVPKDATSTAIKPGMKGSDTDPGAIDAFLNATKQHESGGNYSIYNTSGLSNASGAYQFIGTTWGGYGGYANAAEAPPAVQDAKAREMATALFNQFHSWRLVAIAWYGGPGVAEQVAQGINPGSPQGQGGYLAYGDTIQQMMNGGK